MGSEPIKLGDQVRDRITGLTGIATARCEYISGCDQLLVQPPVKEDGTFNEAKWIDIQRFELVRDQTGAVQPAVVLDNTDTPGADAPAPVR